MVSDRMLKNSIQMWNLLKILNKDKCLDGLNGIDEVYDSQVNIIEEIIYYHNYKEKLNNRPNAFGDDDSINSSQMSDMEDIGDGPNVRKIKNIFNKGGMRDNNSSINS